MKKQLLSVFAALTVNSAVAQFTVSPSWTITQNAAFPNSTLGVQYLDAVNANVVWVVSGDYATTGSPSQYYSRTIDGGQTFTSGIIPNVGAGNTYEIGNMEAIDANTAWIACYNQITSGNGAIFRTTDGGATWVNMTGSNMYTDPNESFLNSVTFLTPSIGLTLGDPVNGEYEIWRTLDGGLSWTQVPGANIPNPLMAGEYGIVDLFTKQGNSNVWFGTNAGRIYRSTDAGLTWSVSVVAGSNTTLTKIAFSSPLNGVVQLWDGSTYYLYQTTDGGATWTLNSVPTNVGFSDLAVVPGTNYYVSAGYDLQTANGDKISYSSNNGTSWTDWGTSGGVIAYTAIDMVDANTGWVGTNTHYFQSLGYPNLYKFNGSLTGQAPAPTSAFYLPPNICLTTGSATAVNNSTGYNLTYSWSASPATGVTFASSSTATTPVVTFANVGTYTITLTATDDFNVSNTSSQIVQVLHCGVTASVSIAATGCQSVALIASNNSTGSPAPSYSWSASPSTGVNFAPSAVASTPSISFGAPGDYTLTMVATNVSGSATSTQVVHINDCRPVPSFSLMLGKTSPHTYSGFVCRKNTVYSQVDTLYTQNTTSTVSAAGNITYSWSISPNVAMSNGILNTPVPGITPARDKRVFFAASSSTNDAVYTITLRATNLSGFNTASQTFTVKNCYYTGVAENSLSENLNVYPNPAHEQLTVSLPNTNNAHKIKMVNILGSVVYEETVKNTTIVNINVSNKAKGVYFLTVEADGEKITQKIIVE